MNADVMIKKRIVAIAAASLLTMVSAADEIAGKCRHASVEAALSVGDVKFGGGRSLDAWRKMGKDINSVYADPLFKDAAGRDFRLKPESPAFKTGFVDFNQSDIGQRKNGNSQ